jgi:hypothetical protein
MIRTFIDTGVLITAARGSELAQNGPRIADYKQFMRDNCIPDYAVDRV